MADSFRTIIVPASLVERVRALAATWPHGAGMFVTPVYTGSELTHYLSTGYIDSSVAYALDNPAVFAEAAGVTVEEAEALRAQLDISQEPWPDALARLGLSLTATEADA